MSSRVLKKLHGTEDLAIIHNADDDPEDEDDDEIIEKKNRLNPFDLLNQQSLSESEVKEDDNETATADASESNASAKKKKKKRKKRQKNTGNYISSDEMNEINKLLRKAAQDKLEGRLKRVHPLLSVELRNLNSQNEMRRTFGKRVVKYDNKRGRPKPTLKTLHLVTPKDTWPPITKNCISMRPVPPPNWAVKPNTLKDPDNNEWFAFEHSSKYQVVQNLFAEGMERTDSDFLIGLIRRYPYHVDSLVHLSEFCKITEDYSLASELMQRAVLVLETALHSSFNLTSGSCRLDYSRQENRSFFIVLFKHAQYLEARACCRTAFELAKLLLSLNPEMDPLAMVLVLDFYALRCKQYEWMVQYYEEYETKRNLAQLPNMAYSYALALFCSNGECEEADKALQYALTMFPSVLLPLLEGLNATFEKRIKTCTYFNPEISGSQPPALYQLVCLYVCRCKVVWRQIEMLPWLERNVDHVLTLFERKDPLLDDYGAKRTIRYSVPPRAILRHVILSDFKEKVPLATFVAKETNGILSHDPLPPIDSFNSYYRKALSSGSSSAGTTAATTTTTTATMTTTTNLPVPMFFQSLLPSFLNNPQQQQQEQQQPQPQHQQQQPQHQQQQDAEAFRREHAAVAAAAAAGGAVAGNREAVAGADPQVDEVQANLNRQLQEINIGNPLAAAVMDLNYDASASYRELTQSFHNIVDAMRDFIHNFDDTLVADRDIDADDQANTDTEDTTDYFD